MGRGRMIANPAYSRFKASMADALAYTPTNVAVDFDPTARVSVELAVSLPRRMDISAIVKAALDAIQMAGLILDDNQVDRLLVYRGGYAKGRQSTIQFQIGAV